MKSRLLTFLGMLLVVACVLSPALFATERTSILAALTNKIPARPDSAMTGSEFARYVAGMDRSAREQAIAEQLCTGNFPNFLRKLKPVQLSQTFDNGKRITATVFAMPDYLSVGSDDDFLLMPMNLRTAAQTAEHLGFVLPTKKIVDAIFDQSEIHFTPEPMAAGPQMCSTAYYVKHNQKIKEQRQSLGCWLGALVSGHKKDVVLTNRLARNQGKIAIYGWHRRSGNPIQPLSTVHGANYADYSHGIRLVSDTVLINNKPRSIGDVLQDPQLAYLLSDEGAMKGIQAFLPVHYTEPHGLAAIFSASRKNHSP